ncbi:MAG: UDP-N-acetyl-D-glucosamine dehydrogenase [Candidatus Omnitrophica bacterium CG07_land_8_20_14_0_80_42_15]|uniref:UDP-N-acetyl-D-glucosamine dehydrogenase n=1 Tax=Candidatus Aquitaenariimonas noxiae TaxID=1974741 RepID=A0A2J0KWW6_9BACT|nr:MAG: UDP-N-acetyl-D-glucosamine dehydrogenase [Candidatus Omnitrophica bacterium CG07_land_8_20_14_0_80_42_15]
MEKVRIGVIGVGSLGVHHARIYSRLDGVELVGVCDINVKKANQIARKYRTQAFTRYKDLFGKVNGVSIVTPTNTHAEVGKAFLEQGVHILVEKPITKTLEDADELLKKARDKNLIIQVGHVERFNAGIRAIKSIINKPVFIECHRLSLFKKRSLDIGVVLDLMIHDIDIILDLVNSKVVKMDALGVKILTLHEDLANVRLQFENGTISNITASRVANKTMRKIRIFQEDAYISLDYEKQEAYIYRKAGSKITRKKIRIKKEESLLSELKAFVDCVKNNEKPLVSGEEAREALRMALEITKQINP